MTDVAELCRQLTVLRRALAAATTPGHLDDRATPHMTVAATLTPTAPPAAGGRRVPGSRPPVSLELIHAAQQLDRVPMALAADLRAALGHTTRDRTPVAALRAIESHWDGLSDMSALKRRIPAVLGALNGYTRRLLGLDDPWLVLGPCPEIHQDAVPVAWDEDDQAVAYVEVHDCHVYDPAASYAATVRRGAPVDIWRRAHLRVPQHGDTATAVIECEGCGRRIEPDERARFIAIAATEALDNRERMPA